MTTTTANGVIVSTTHFSSFSYRRKNRRQNDALTSAAFLLIGNGIGFGYGLFVYPLSVFQTYMTIYFVGIIIGALAASFLLHKLRKSVHYYLAGVTTLLSGILYLAISPNTSLRISDGNIAANFISGLSFGIVLLTAITHGAEISVKYLRSFNIFQLQLSIDVGLFIFCVIVRATYQRGEGLDYSQALGVALIVCSILSFATTYFFCIESPEFLYETNNNNEALVTVKRLRKEHADTLEILNDLEEIQNSVRIANDTNLLTAITTKENLIAFGKIFILRFAYILGTGLPLNIRFLRIFLPFLSSNNQVNFGTILYMLIRILSGSIGSLCIFKTGNKKLLLISLFLSGLISIIINSIFIANSPVFSRSIIDCLGVLIIFYQLSFGLASGGISLLAMSEGFSFKIKTYYNAIIITLECLIHIIIIYTINTFDLIGLLDINDSGTTTFIFISGIVQLIVCGFTFMFIPETYQKSLKESNELY